MSDCGVNRVYTGKRQGIQTAGRDGDDGHVHADLLECFLGLQDSHRTRTKCSHGLADG